MKCDWDSLGIRLTPFSSLLPALIIKDPYIYASNILNHLLGIYYLLTTFRLTPTPRARHILLAVIISGILYIYLGALIAFLVITDVPTRETFYGSWAVAMLVVFYGSPLASIYKVVKERDASCIQLPLAIAM